MRTMLAVFLMCFALHIQAFNLNKIVIFGDSLSDNGNFYEHINHIFPPSPPYHQGRFSDGAVWIEQLLNFYYPQNINKHLEDYAFAGAGIASEDADWEVISLQQQVESYLAKQPEINENILFIIEIGTNNYLFSSDFLKDTLMQEAIFVNEGIKKAALRLKEKGAKNIMVLNIPDIGTIPSVNNLIIAKDLSDAVKQHNKILYNNFLELQQSYPQVNWFYLNIYDFIKEIMDNAHYYNFNNIADACFDPGVNYFAKNFLNDLKNPPVYTNFMKLNCQGFLFFDHIHLGVEAHFILAQKTKQYLDTFDIKFE